MQASKALLSSPNWEKRYVILCWKNETEYHIIAYGLIPTFVSVHGKLENQM